MATEENRGQQLFRLSVEPGEEKRLDIYVTEHCPALSRSHARKLIDDGLVTVNGRPAKASRLVQASDVVEVVVPPPEPLAVEPESIPLDVVFEDSDIIVIDKPAGMTVHPGAGHARHTLVNALLAHCSDLAGVGGVLRPGIVHRLDKDTSGLMLIAKNDRAHAALSRQWKERSVEKRYLALVRGRLEPPEGIIDAAIGRDPSERKRMAVLAGGRAAVTAYRVRDYLEGTTLVDVSIETGRTHQIRVHFAALGHPVVGDIVYGKSSRLVGRQFLHAYRLSIRHPADDRAMTFDSPLPDDLRRALDAAGGCSPA